VIALRDPHEAQSTIVLARLSWGLPANYIGPPEVHPLKVYREYGRVEEAELAVAESATPQEGASQEGAEKARKRRRLAPHRYPMEAVVGVCVLLQRPK
jgi:hypothetical protein